MPSPISLMTPLNSWPKPMGSDSPVIGCGSPTLGQNVGPPSHSWTSFGLSVRSGRIRVSRVRILCHRCRRMLARPGSRPHSQQTFLAGAREVKSSSGIWYEHYLKGRGRASEYERNLYVPSPGQTCNQVRGCLQLAGLLCHSISPRASSKPSFMYVSRSNFCGPREILYKAF